MQELRIAGAFVMAEDTRRPGGARPGGTGSGIYRWSAAIALALLLTLPAGELHAQAAGEAVAVSGSVSASGPQGSRALVAGAPVYMGDTIDTGVFGEAQIVFTDETRLAIAPGSQVLLDAYVMQTPTTTSSFVVNAARGAFRFISGNSNSNAYQVATPTATIGIRGTAFDVSDRTAQRTNALLYDGRITACSRAGQCADLDRSCEIAIITADPAQPVVRSDTSQLVPNAIRFQFPYLVDEARLLPAFQVQAARCLGAGGASAPIRGGDGGEREPPSRDPGGDGDGEGDGEGDGDGDTGGDGDGDTGGDGDGDTGGNGNGDTGGNGDGDTGGNGEPGVDSPS